MLLPGSAQPAASSGAPPRSGFKLFAAALGALILAAFPDVIFGAATFYHRDFGIFGYPLASYLRDSFWRGEVPLWNPLSHGGLPFLAQWNTLALYPLSLLYLLLPLSYSLGLFCLLHQFLAGAGMYCLALAWTRDRLGAALAGVSFAFGGLALSCIKWPNNISALGWMPWVILLARRGWQRGGRDAWLAIGAGAMQMLTGAPEIILFTWCLAGIFWLADWLRPPVAPSSEHETASRRSMFHRAAAIVVMVGALAAAQLLPFLDLLAHSHRDSSFVSRSWSLPAWGWANFFVPLFRCFESHQGVFAQLGQYWTSSYFPGLAVLLFALSGAVLDRRKETLILALIAIGSVILAMGHNLPVYPALLRAIPGLGVIRYPVKFIVFASFALPLLAAFGAARLRRAMTEPPPGQRRFLTAGALFTVALLSCIAGVLWLDRARPHAISHWIYTMDSGARSVGAVVLAALGAAFLFKARSQAARAILSAALVLLVWGELMLHTPRLNPTIPRWVYDPGLTRREMKWNPEPAPGASRAMLSPWAEWRLNHLALTNAIEDHMYGRYSLFANANLLENVPKVDGFFSLYFPEETAVRSLLYASTNQSLPQLAAFLGVSQISAPDSMIQWEARTNFLPFATAGQKPVFTNTAGVLAALASPEFRPAAEVFLPAELESEFSRPAARATARLTRFSPHEIEIAAEADSPAFVTLAQARYHPWQARVNGQPAPILQANHAYQAIPIPAGSSVVRLSYEDRAFALGKIISLLALAGWGAAWFRLRSKKGAEGPEGASAR